MSDPNRHDPTHPPHPGRRPGSGEVRAALLGLDPPLATMVEGLLGLEAPIDWACLDSSGRVVLVQWAERGEDLAGLTHLAAQLRWVEPRLPDWQALAPDRKIDPSLLPGGLLLSRMFSLRTREAAALIPGDLHLRQWVDVPGRAGILLGASGDPDPTTPPEARAPIREMSDSAPGPGSGSHFRTHLRDEDLS